MNQTGILTVVVAVYFCVSASNTSGATLYQDNFDNVAAGTGPVPQIGTYLGGNAWVQTGYEVPPSLPNYLDNNRTIGRMNYTGDLQGLALQPGATVHAEFNMLAISGYSSWGLIRNGNIVDPHDPTNGWGIVIVSTSPNGSVMAINSAGALVSTGLTHQFNTWQKWQIDYTVGESNYTLTIGNQVAHLGAAYMKDSAASSLGHIFDNTFSATTRALLDNVVVTGPLNPEPNIAGVSRGRQILLNRGLQLQANVTTEDDNDHWAVNYPGFVGFADANQLLDANFTGVNFWHNDTTSVKAEFQAQVGNRPWQWARITQPGFAGDLTPGELDYIDNFVSISYQDELPQTQANLDAEKIAFSRWNALYPNALAYTNLNWSTQNVEDYAGLRNYMQYTRPDMLMFDMYPGYDGFVFAPYRNLWYSTMQRYRTVALEGLDGTGNDPLPYGQHLDLWRRSSPTGTLPPESFVRLQQFASWALGFTFTSAFIYNEPPGNPAAGVYSSMFIGPGDSSPTVVFDYVAESNRQSRNLGPALVRLVSTDIRMIPGSGKSVTDTGILAWNASANGGDNYIIGITPTLSQGGPADSNYDDILIGYFKPLLADNSDYPFADETHFMIVNGASQGTAAASAQWYRITFNFRNSGITALERLSRETGLIERVQLTHIIGSIYELDLTLPGGTGDLFRYAPLVPGDFNGNGEVDGADFVAWQTHFPKASGALLSDGDADGDGD
ncbi:MAG: hypothetical protein IT427_05140, partial [Pirellulales bacterium]|nr:hypothetical protein [Pirellulales bacterium]